MKVSLINFTQNARELLIFTKNTRHLSGESRFEEVLDMTERAKQEELDYVFNTISSSWEFVNYTFLLQDVTRSLTHQLVRHRHNSFAQQSLRVFPAESFKYFVPDKLEKESYQLAIYDATMSQTQENYNLLLKHGVNVQDARGVLPMNICTNIIVGANLRSLSNLMETRLCVRAQGEFQMAAMLMRNLVADVHPWAEKVLAPSCITKGTCMFPRFTGCPLKNKYHHLQPIEDSLTDKVKCDWEVLMEKQYSPQPEQQK
jgi:thymidylate synthase (FAD)